MEITSIFDEGIVVTKLKKNIVNVTPHDVIILDPKYCEFDKRTKQYVFTDLKVTEQMILKIYPKTNYIARCTTSETVIDSEDFPAVKMTFGQIEGLPNSKKNTLYIASFIVQTAAKSKGRYDVITPVKVVRDLYGNSVGCLALGVS